MAEQENQGSNQEGKQVKLEVPIERPKPNPNILPPNFEYVTEGFEPKKDKIVVYDG